MLFCQETFGVGGGVCLSHVSHSVFLITPITHLHMQQGNAAHSASPRQTSERK